MPFNIDFDIASLLFLSLIAYKYYSKRQFPLLSNKLFSVMLCMAIVNLALDIGGTITLAYFRGGFSWIPYLVNVFYYIVELLFPISLTTYLCTLIANKRPVPFRYYVLFAIPSLIYTTIFLCTFPAGLVFRIGSDSTYEYGPFSKLTYICLGTYLLLTILILVGQKRMFTRNEQLSVNAMIGLPVVGAVLQFIFPQMLLTGTALSLSIAIFYFTLQDPSRMLDATTGLFNGMAFEQLMTANYLSIHKTFHIVAIKLQGLHNYRKVYGRDTSNQLIKCISNLLPKTAQTWSFRLSDTQFVTIFESTRDMEKYLQWFDYEKDEQINIGNLSVDPQITSICVHNAEQFRTYKNLCQVLDNALTEPNIRRGPANTVNLDQKNIVALMREVEVENMVRKSLSTGECFQIFYQPIYSLKKDGFTSAEALLRFRSPTFGRLMPDEFIPVIEQKGLATQMDEMVVSKVFAHIRDGVFEGSGLDCVHINLSAASFVSKQTTGHILQMVKEYGIDPKFVVFEITETASSLSASVLAECFARLCDAGFGMALDDFGTGYANITQVLHLPFSFVKLDRTIVQDSGTLMNDVVQIFRSFPVQIVAEGVENEQQRARVKAVGIEEIQGYFYARPMPVEDMKAFLAERSCQ